jgi:hypothetical protein
MMNELVYVVDDEAKAGKADELSASIIHQLNQPLTAMLATIFSEGAARHR